MEIWHTDRWTASKICKNIASTLGGGALGVGGVDRSWETCSFVTRVKGEVKADMVGWRKGVFIVDLANVCGKRCTCTLFEIFLIQAPPWPEAVYEMDPSSLSVKLDRLVLPRFFIRIGQRSAFGCRCRFCFMIRRRCSSFCYASFSANKTGLWYTSLFFFSKFRFQRFYLVLSLLVNGWRRRCSFRMWFHYCTVSPINTQRSRSSYLYLSLVEER